MQGSAPSSPWACPSRAGGEEKLLSSWLIFFCTLGLTRKDWEFRNGWFPLEILYRRRSACHYKRDAEITMLMPICSNKSVQFSAGSPGQGVHGAGWELRPHSLHLSSTKSLTWVGLSWPLVVSVFPVVDPDVSMPVAMCPCCLLHTIARAVVPL